MDSLNGSSLWDYPLPPSLPALADEDFITLLQKQFGANNGFSDVDNDKLKDDTQPLTANINPQSLTRLPIPKPVESPPSDDSSPSPNEASSSKSRRQSSIFDLDGPGHMNEETGDDDSTLKRKASGEDFDDDDEPSHKSQHTSGSRKSGHSRRKSTGNPGVDENRLLKRKEQNRAAQRAFRERKEKHVKDLEDKVAALEEKNASAHQENETLREVVSRLQSENMRLRQSSFTFSVPPTAPTPKQPDTSGVASPSNGQHGTQVNLFNTPPSTTTSNTASTHDSPESLFANENGDNQLSFLGQNLISLNHPAQQQTATSDAMNMDFGFGPSVPQLPYTTIASNPLFMSFREPDVFDVTNQNQNHNGSQTGQQFDMSQQLFPGWPDVPMNGNGNHSMQAFDLTNSLDELFGSTYGNSAGLDFLTNGSKGSPSTSLSPVSHQIANGSSPGAASSSSSSSSSSQSSPLPAPTPSSGPADGACVIKKCSKANIQSALARDTGSMFVTRDSSAQSDDSSPSPPMSGADDACNEFPPCKGLQLPKTQKSDKNVELMSAWKQIRHDPKFQVGVDVDINSLCSEFAAKARCDGCHVVIEPNGMQEIMESVTKQKKAKQQSVLFSASNAAGLLSK